MNDTITIQKAYSGGGGLSNYHTIIGAAHGRPMRSPIYGYPKDFCCFSGLISSHGPY